MDKAPLWLPSHGFCDARLYNHERLHQALGYRAPRWVFEEAMRVLKLGAGEKPLALSAKRRQNEALP
jgi:hypothetical protein